MTIFDEIKESMYTMFRWRYVCTQYI